MWLNSPSMTGRCFTGTEENEMLLTLLATRWRGDVVVFMGDYANFKEGDRECCGRLQELLEERGYGHAACDFMYDSLIANGSFAVTKDSPRNRRNDPDNEDLDYYSGSCDLEIEHFRYVVNDVKREYIDYRKTPIVWVHEDGIKRYDPFPEIMASVVWEPEDPDEIQGRWLGDVVRPTNIRPNESYSLIADKYVHSGFTEPFICDMTDEEFRAAMKADGLCLDTMGITEVIEILASNQCVKGKIA